MVMVNSCGHPAAHSSVLVDGDWLCYSCVQNELSDLRKRTTKLERMVYGCVRYFDVMQNGYDEQLYYEIIAKFEPKESKDDGT